MCGIFGFIQQQETAPTHQQQRFDRLMKAAYWRGKEASGAAALLPGHTVCFIKSDLNGKELLQAPEYARYKAAIAPQRVMAQVGHSRLATHGSQLVHLNNQPVVSHHQHITVVHNGIVTNTADLWQKLGHTDPVPVLDTAVLTDYLEHLLLHHPLSDAIARLYQDMEGSASLAIVVPALETIILSTNTGSLYYVKDEQDHTTYFASERIFLEEALADRPSGLPLAIMHLKPQTALVLTAKTSMVVKFDGAATALSAPALHAPATVAYQEYSVYEKKSAAAKLYTVTNSLSVLQQHKFNDQKIKSLKRCVKCILPETAPFIAFDAQGVCNYCNEHQRIKVKGRDALEAVLQKYRKGNGEPDCLVAFSGGRDSSYGLHFLKEEMGMQPLAYTYDWGMVTDLARRNQARMLGKLGVEHILVSADITMKRKHIRENILAWMKRPHLGMVPLFMEGDKQCEFFADQIMKKYKLDLMFFFRGNELERDEFKTGHCGVKDADPGGVIHHLEPLKKIKLLSFYAGQYFTNPAYFNSSFFDTSLGFFATYIQPHDYLFLWHYIKWDEHTIVNTLKTKYGWETPTETKATWRTDDGTSAFYNYIYYQGQGYTENDSFRSRQIREGLMDRATALELVHEENKPRYEALQWYFDMVGLDGHKVLTVVDNMKKMY